MGVDKIMYMEKERERKGERENRDLRTPFRSLGKSKYN